MAKGNNVGVQGAGPPEGAGTAVKRGASRENVINKDMMLAWIKAAAPDKCKGIFEVGLPGAPVESGLRLGVGDPPQQRVHGRAAAGRPREVFRQQRALVVAALPLLARMQRHRD